VLIVFRLHENTGVGNAVERLVYRQHIYTVIYFLEDALLHFSEADVGTLNRSLLVLNGFKSASASLRIHFLASLAVLEVSKATLDGFVGRVVRGMQDGARH